MKILIVIGARPNFMKVAPIIAAIKQHNATACSSTPGLREDAFEPIEHVLVHTGQHYDDAMSGAFFRDLDLPVPDVHLGVGSGSHAIQTAEIMKKFEQVVTTERPDVVIIVGDVNSTVACALVTAKVSFDSAGRRPLIAHVEAGLRSFDRTMPEEVNRIVTDHLSDVLFVTEESGLQNLQNEGVSAAKVHFVGNTMIDSVLALVDKAEASSVLDELGLRSPAESGGMDDAIARYALLTLHRPSNVDDRDTFMSILAGLEELAADCSIIFPVHPRTRQRIREFGFELSQAAAGGNGRQEGNGRGSMSSGHGIIFTDPLGYLDFLCLMKHAAMVITDSGGIQEETTCLGIPCVTVRENTERPITVQIGTNRLAGTRREGIREAIRQQLRSKASACMPENWDGQAAARIVHVLSHARHAQAMPSEVPREAATIVNVHAAVSTHMAQ